MLEPTRNKNILPETCACGHLDLDPVSIKPFYTQQYIELPEINIGIGVKSCIVNKDVCIYFVNRDSAAAWSSWNL